MFADSGHVLLHCDGKCVISINFLELHFDQYLFIFMHLVIV